MANLLSRTKSTYINIGVFLFVFVLTSWFTSNVAASNGFTSFFTKSTLGDRALLYARQSLLFSNSDEMLNLIMRIYFASFIKDAIFATLSPKLIKSSISSKLINQVEQDTFNEDWIPNSNYDHFARRSMLTKSVVERPNTGGISKRTSVYIVGHGLIKILTKLCQFTSEVFLKLVLWAQWGLAYFSNGVIGVLFFTIRSVFCSLSSSSLMILHLLQIILRTIRMIYNLLEVVLSRSCAIVNDFSLLSIDVIRAAAVNRGEKTFTELADQGPFGGVGDGQ